MGRVLFGCGGGASIFYKPTTTTKSYIFQQTKCFVRFQKLYEKKQAVRCEHTEHVKM